MPRSFYLFPALAFLTPAEAWASAGPQHTDPVASVVLSLALILVAAKAGGELAARLGQPQVLGELVMGVILGNLTLVGFHGLEHMRADPTLEMLAGIGVLVLLFEVGLESTVREMLDVGPDGVIVTATSWRING